MTESVTERERERERERETKREKQDGGEQEVDTDMKIWGHQTQHLAVTLRPNN